MADIYEETLKHFLAPVKPFLDDRDVSEIMINGHQSVYIEKAGRVEAVPNRFPDEAALMAAAQNIAEFVGRPFDAEHHSLDARLPDGSRVHAILPPSARGGICVTIRKFQQSAFDLRRLVERGSLGPQAAEFLEIAVALHKNMVISGGTGTGKTSLLNALSQAIPADERIIVIEDSSELQLKQPHTVYLEAQPARADGTPAVTIRDLFVDSLRMRPDRIVVGEVRRGEALDLVQSMLSGHAGSMSTVHANTPHDAAGRLETLCLMSDTALPVHVARAQVASAVDLVVQLARLPDKTRRIVQISELLALDAKDQYQWRDLFVFRGRGRDGDGRIAGQLAWTGARPTFAHQPCQLGLDRHVHKSAGLFSREESEDRVSGDASPS